MLARSGGQGDGPGEFRWITSIETGPADSLYVYDGSLQRLTAVSPDGQARTTPFRVAGSGTGVDGIRVLSRLADGGWVGKGIESPRRGEVGQILQDTVVVGVLDEHLERLQVLERVPGMMSATMDFGGRRAFGLAAFSPYALQATWGRCVFVARGDRTAISIYSASGDVIARRQGPGAQRPVTEGLKDDWIAHRLELADSAGQEVLRRAMSDVAWLDQIPLYYQMVVDQWGRLWLQRYEPPMGLGPRWHVLSQGGEHLGDVLLSKPLRIYEITENGILGSRLGEFDQELVELVPLDWDAPAADPAAECL